MNLKKENNFIKEKNKKAKWFSIFLTIIVSIVLLLLTYHFLFTEWNEIKKHVSKDEIKIEQQRTTKSEVAPLNTSFSTTKTTHFKTVSPGDLILTVQNGMLQNMLKHKMPFISDKLYIYFGGFTVGSKKNNANFTIKAFSQSEWEDKDHPYSDDFSFINVSKGDVITVPLTKIKLVVKDIDVQGNSITFERTQ